MHMPSCLLSQDAYEFSSFPDQLTGFDLTGNPAAPADKVVEVKPHFYEWASVLPGMICVARKNKTQVSMPNPASINLVIVDSSIHSVF